MLPSFSTNKGKLAAQHTSEAQMRCFHPQNLILFDWYLHKSNLDEHSYAEATR